MEIARRMNMCLSPSLTTSANGTVRAGAFVGGDADRVLLAALAQVGDDVLLEDVISLKAVFRLPNMWTKSSADSVSICLLNGW